MSVNEVAAIVSGPTGRKTNNIGIALASTKKRFKRTDKGVYALVGWQAPILTQEQNDIVEAKPAHLDAAAKQHRLDLLRRVGRRLADD